MSVQRTCCLDIGFRNMSPVLASDIVWLIHVPCGRGYYVISAVFVDILPKLLYVNVPY